MTRARVAALAVAMAGSAALSGRLVAAGVDRRLNTTALPGPYGVRPDALHTHRSATIVDLHCDALLWRRDLAQRGRSGHLDLPRLRAGNVALQVFAVTSHAPMGLNFERNEPRRDLVTVLQILQGRPMPTWTSRVARALDASDRLHALAAADAGLRIVRTRADLEALVAARTADPRTVGGLLAIECAHALDGRLDALDELVAAGFRMIGLQHFFDNDAGGSSAGVGKGGLTDFGRELIGRMETAGVALDLAHSSAAVIDEALRIATKPVVVSHTGVRGTCDNSRNLSDDQLRGVAATGGAVGIALFEHAVGGTGVDATARAMRHTADVIGVEHVALGTDWDGAISCAVDASGLCVLTEAMLDVGFSGDDVHAILGGNALRVLRATLPEGTATLG